MRLALIGCGQVVERYHLPALSALPEVRVSCIVEASRERRREIANLLAGIPSYADLDEALAADPTDAALIATAPATHAVLARRCLAAGWHVLIEKPMAACLVEAGEIVAEAALAERRVAVGFNRRFRRSWSMARNLLAAVGPGGFEHVTFTLAFDTKRWRSAASLSEEGAALAGLIEDVIPHQADVLAFLFDRPIVRLRAQEVRFRKGHSIGVTYVAQLRDGSAVRCTARHGPGHLELFEACRGGRRLAVAPEAVIDGVRMPILRRRCSDAWAQALGACRRILRQPSSTVASFVSQYRAFQSVVRGESPGVLADGMAGAAACAVGDALRGSVVGGGADWIEVRELTR